MVPKSLGEKKGNHLSGYGPRVGIWVGKGSAGPELTDLRHRETEYKCGVTEEGSHY